MPSARKRVGEDGAPSDQDDNPGTGGIGWVDDDLEVLADHGGPTQTLMPRSGSPAIGLGENCPPTDQCGSPRPASGCTAGVVEVQ